MSEILGLLDSLESAILDGRKIPMTEQIIINERDILHIIDKIRLVVSSGGDVIRKAVDVTPNSEDSKMEPPSMETINQASRYIDDAKVHANRIKDGANHYADNVLANLQLMLTKIQKQVLTIEKNIESGRKVLETERGDYESAEEDPRDKEHL